MSKPFSVNEDQIKHYVLPEVTGPIVGLEKDHIRPQTVEDIEAIQKEAYEEGKKQGYEDGLKEGRVGSCYTDVDTPIGV